MRKAGSAVDATLIAAPSSTKNGSGTRDPEMQSTQKGRNWYFGVKAHVGVDAESSLVHTVVGTAANVHDINVTHALLHGEETSVYADAGYQASKSASKRVGLDGMLRCGPVSEGNELEGPCRCDIRQDRTTEGRHSGEGRASFL
jgi:IS5 family transposase